MLLIGALLTGAGVLAADYGDFSVLTPQEFRLVGEDLGKALSWKGIEPAEQLGILGFDVGVGLQVGKLRHADLLRRTANGSGPSTLLTPTLRAHKGLPLNFDIGANYGQVIGTNIGVWGVEARWAVVAGNFLLPAVALRFATAGITGVNNLSLRSNSFELTVSKGFANFTPYVGLGRVWTTARPRGAPDLREETFTNNRYYAGLNVNLGLNFALEVDRTGGSTTLGIKTGFRFASWF